MEQQNWTSGIYIPADCEKTLTYCRTTRHPVQQGTTRVVSQKQARGMKEDALYQSLQLSLTQDPCELSGLHENTVTSGIRM